MQRLITEALVNEGDLLEGHLQPSTKKAVSVRFAVYVGSVTLNRDQVTANLGLRIGYETTISGNPSAIVLFEASGTYKLATREVEIEPTTVMACLCARICSVRRQDLGRSQFRNPL